MLWHAISLLPITLPGSLLKSNSLSASHEEAEIGFPFLGDKQGFPLCRGEVELLSAQRKGQCPRADRMGCAGLQALHHSSGTLCLLQ